MSLRSLSSFWADESGATAVEYGLITGLVSITVIFALHQISASLQSIFALATAGMDAGAAMAGGAP